MNETRLFSHLFVAFLVSLLLFPALTQASGQTSYTPGAKKGQWVYYGQVNRNFQTNPLIPNPIPNPVEHVTAINSTVTDVTVDSITLSQVWSFDNGTSRTIVFQGNVATGTGNYSNTKFGSWFIAGGLTAGDYAGTNSLRINETVAASYWGALTIVNVWNFTSNIAAYPLAISNVWDRSTGLLLEATYHFSYPGFYTAFLDVRATKTNIPATTPDFTIALNNGSITATANTTTTTSITLTTPNNLTINLAASSSPAGLTCSLTPVTINVRTSAQSTLSCRGPAANYQVTITAASGVLSRSKTLTYQIITPAATLFGLNPIIVYAIVGAAVAVILAVTLFTFLKRRKPPSETLPPSGP